MFNCAQLDQHRKGAVPARSSDTRYAIYYTPQPGTALAAFVPKVVLIQSLLAR